MNEDLYELDGTVLEEYYGLEAAPRIPEGVTEIGSLAFSENEALERIDLPAQIRKIGIYAFNECCHLQEAVLHEGLEEIEDSAFSYTDIQHIRLPKGLKKLGKEAFCSTSLAEITIPGGVETIEMMTFFQCDELKTLVLEPGVRSIGVSAFAMCEGLEDITIPDTVEEIASSAFWGCESICRVHASESWKQSHPMLYLRILISSSWCDHLLRDIPPRAACRIENGVLTEYLGHFEHLRIGPDWGVTEIGPGVFFCRYKLRSVELPEGVRTIGNDAFAYCVRLERVGLPESLETIGDGAFCGCSLKEIYLPGALRSIGAEAFHKSPVQRFAVSEQWMERHPDQYRYLLEYARRAENA